MFKKILTLFLVLLLVFVFCGCAGNENLKEKTIVESLGIDYTDGNFNVTVLMYKPQSPDSQSEEKTEILSVNAKTLGVALSKLSALSGKEPFYANNRIVILGKAAIDSKLSEIMDFVIRDTDMREDCYLLAAESAQKVLENEQLTKAENNYIFTLLQKNTESGNCAVMTAMQAANGSIMGLGDIFMPFISAEKDKIKIENTILFFGQDTAVTLDAENSRSLLILRNELSRPIMSVETAWGSASVKILDIDTSIKTGEKDTKINIDIDVDCKITESQSAKITEDDIKNALESDITKGVEEVLGVTANDGIDVVNLTKTLRKYKTEYYLSTKGNKNQMISSLDFSVKTNAEIMRTGRKSE